MRTREGSCASRCVILDPFFPRRNEWTSSSRSSRRSVKWNWRLPGDDVSAARLPASMRTREELMSLIEGRLSTASAKDELVKLATRLVVEEALEGEAGDAIGREYYEHGARPGQGYRNGTRAGRLKTAEWASLVSPAAFSRFRFRQSGSETARS